ncbi:unnamed protein product [Lota lota]
MAERSSNDEDSSFSCVILDSNPITDQHRRLLFLIQSDSYLEDEIDDEGRGRLLILDDSGIEEFVDDTGYKKPPGLTEENCITIGWLSAKADRKKRSTYTMHRTLELEKEFLYNMYLTTQRWPEISQNLDLTDRQVKSLFQNRRMKKKKQHRSSRATVNNDNSGT